LEYMRRLRTACRDSGVLTIQSRRSSLAVDMFHSREDEGST
jgi:hypothetical protein